MNNRDIQALIDKICIVRNEKQLQELFEKLKPGVTGKPVRLAFVNAHAFNLCWNDPGFLQNLLDCDYVLRDGAGMKIFYRLLGREAGINMNGTDLIPRLVDLYKGHDVALLGTDTPYLENAAAYIGEKGAFPVLVKNGFHETGIYLDAIRNTPAPLIILGMGMPKQEFVAAEIAHNLHLSCLIICGGAILDFLGGKVKRAPEFFRKAGLEWFYRLWQEPRRLFKRYVLGNISFLWRAMAFVRHPRAADCENLKILHVVRQYAPSIGGLESYVHSMTRHQKSLGHNPEILTLNKIFHGSRDALPAQDSIDGIPVHRIRFLGKRRFFIPLVSPLFFREYDIVHVHNTDVFFDYIGPLSLFTGVPCVATTHGGFFHTQDFSLIKRIYFHTITRFSALFYKALFAISHNDEKTFRKISQKVSYEPNAVEPLGKDIYAGEDFIYIGRLAQNKNLPKLIEVFSILKKEHNIPGKLHIVGPEWDVLIDDLMKIATTYEIHDHVVCYGAADAPRMKEIASTCGYFASASLYEGFGMSMLEGMSVGLLPLVHSNESFAQLVKESGVGICTDFDNARAAAQAIASYLSDIALQDRILAQNFTHKFSWDGLTLKTLKIYKEILS